MIGSSFTSGASRTWVVTSVILSMYIVVVNACCPNACSGQGICTNNGNGCLCKCFQGYTAGDCSRRLCPTGTAWGDMPLATDRAHLPIMCSGRGQCDLTTGKCNCDAGFTGLACNRLACPNDCSRHGDCRSLKFNAFRKDKGLGLPVRYDSVWDSDMIYGCVCDDGYEGGDCSKRVCATGDDPLTGASTDTLFGLQKNEKQSVLCAATSGTFTLTFRGQTTVPISATDSADQMSQKINALTTLNSVNVLYSGTSTTACTPDGNSVTLEFTQNFNSLPLVVGDGLKLSHAGVGSVPRLVITKSEIGTKENDVCSNRGRCDQTSGVCNCYNGFTTSNGNGKYGNRGDCGAATTTITSCPGDTACSGHGYCSGSPQFRCFCSDGWTSGDCSVRTCPQGMAWFDMPISDNRAHQLAICSGVGTCDISKGECTCPPPFEGAACERMKCPGNDQPCSGNGRCLLMSQMAMEARVNGEPIAVTYGQTPNLPRTWDWNKIQVCLCDKGFSGHDCSLRHCPKGDDPRTTGQQLEIQTIRCVHTQVSTFQLSFRGLVSPMIPSNASLIVLKQILESMDNIQQVDMTYSNGITACTLTGNPINTISIRFRYALGDVPPLRFLPGLNAPNFLSFIIDTDGTGLSVRGTVENVECSNNGICNYGTGICTCFDGMASSNGINQVGLRQDCGYRLPTEDALAHNVQIQA